MAEQMRMQGSALSAPQYNTYVTTIQEAINDTSYDPGIDVLTPEQQIMIQNNPEAQLAQDALYMNQLGNANNSFGDDINMLLGNDPSFDSPSSSGSYGGSLVTGELTGDFTPIPGFLGNIADTVVSNVAPEYAMEKQTEQLAAAYGSTQNPDGSYNFVMPDTSGSPQIDTSTFQTTYDPGTYNEQVDAYAVTYGDDTFVDAVTAAGDDVSDFLAPVVGSSNNNDDNDYVSTTSSGATVIPTGATIATGTVLNSADDPVVNVNGVLYNEKQSSSGNILTQARQVLQMTTMVAQAVAAVEAAA